jgi:putative selenate reductase
MSELRPYPFEALTRRMFRELERQGSIFDLPSRRFFLGDPLRDTSVHFHGRAASSPLGPAAGPHTQMAQNLVLAWLAGCRIFELKTVQVLDELTIPRPCIDAQNVCFNVEWSQELRLAESLEEYVKASMAVEMLQASGRLPLVPGFDRWVFDMSVGYDLAGLESESVQAFVSGLVDARPSVERLRRSIPDELREYRDLDFSTRLASSVTLSTFHGCPPDEIASMAELLMQRFDLACTVKLNPTLLGRERLLELLHDGLGYHELRVPESAFVADTRWEQALEIVDRLGGIAAGLGTGFGVKLTNTLVVENHRDFFPPGESSMYLSGPPLHVLAMDLVRRFRRELGERYPISFSAGIDRTNYPDAVALGLVPVTVCTDLLKPGGYGRASSYHGALAARMDGAGARNVGDFVLRAYGLGLEGLGRIGLQQGTPERGACERAWRLGEDLRAAVGSDELHRRWLAATAVLNTEHYVGGLQHEPRYGAAHNARPPRKVPGELAMFDCLACDKCIPVCPNDANFRFTLPPLDVPILLARREGERWRWREDGRLRIEKAHQIANFADLCNECGNCDVFCPEHGRPYRIKPRFFGSLEGWLAEAPRDGFHVEGRRGYALAVGRLGGVEYRLDVDGSRMCYEGPGFSVELDEADPQGSLSGQAPPDGGEIDFRSYHVLRWLLDAVLDPSSVNPVNSL